MFTPDDKIRNFFTRYLCQKWLWKKQTRTNEHFRLICPVFQVFCFYCEPGLNNSFLSRQFFKIIVCSLRNNICEGLDFSDEENYIGILRMSTLWQHVQKTCSMLRKFYNKKEREGFTEHKNMKTWETGWWWMIGL